MAATVAVELTGNEARLVQALNRSEAQFKKSFANMGRSPQQVEAALSKMVDSAIAGMAKTQVSVRDWSRELKKLGPAGRAALEAFEQQAAKTSQFGRRSVDEIVADFERLDPAIGQEMRKAAQRVQELESKANETQLTGLIAQLKQVRGHAGDLGTMFEQRMLQATLASEGGIDSLIAKIESADPSMTEVTQTWKREWEQASQAAERSIGKDLEAIRELGPEGAKAADELVREFQMAGSLSAAAVDKIFRPLDKSDVRVSRAMKGIKQSITPVENQLKVMSGQLSSLAKIQLVSLASQFFDVHAAIRVVNTALEDQQKLLEQGRSLNISLAEAQAKASANLSSLSPEVRRHLLEDFAGSLSDEHGLGKEGRLAVIEAIGDSQSSGALSPESIKEAVRVSTELNKFTQGDIAQTASALIKAGVSSGNEDFESLASLLYVAQEKSQITNARKFLEISGKILPAVTKIAAPGQEGVAAMEGLAVAAALSRSAGDSRGEPTGTNTADLAQRLDEMFTAFDERSAKARAELAELQANGSTTLSHSDRLRLSELQSRQAGRQQTDALIASTESDIARLEADKDSGLQGAGLREANKELRDLREKLRELEDKRFGAHEQASLADLLARQQAGAIEFNKREAELKKIIAEGQVNGVDISAQRPGSILKDLNYLREAGKGQLALDIVGAFGEVTFKQGFRELLVGGRTSDEANANMAEALRAKGPERYQTITGEMAKGATSAQKLALQELRRQGDEFKQLSANLAGADLQQLRETVATIVESTRRPGIYGGALDVEREMLTGTSPWFIRHAWGLGGDNALVEGLDAINLLSERGHRFKKSAMADGALDQREQSTLERIRSGIDQVATTYDDPKVGSRFTEAQIQEALEIVAWRLERTRTAANADGMVSDQEQRTLNMFERINKNLEAMLKVQKEVAANTADTADATEAGAAYSEKIAATSGVSTDVAMQAAVALRL